MIPRPLLIQNYGMPLICSKMHVKKLKYIYTVAEIFHLLIIFCSVIGLDGIRVVDASVMPFITNGNPQSVVYGLAEKAADMILQKWTNISYS